MKVEVFKRNENGILGEALKKCDITYTEYLNAILIEY